MRSLNLQKDSLVKGDVMENHNNHYMGENGIEFSLPSDVDVGNRLIVSSTNGLCGVMSILTNL